MSEENPIEEIIEDDHVVVEQNAETYYGCIPLDKANAIVIGGGAPASAVFQLRDSSGVPTDISTYFPDDVADEDNPYGAFVKFALGDETMVARGYEKATVVDAKSGRVQFDIPEYIYDVPCIYKFYIAIGNKETFLSDGRAVYVSPDRGVILVEWTPFMVHLQHCPIKHRIVPALEDVRRKLDDFVGKNDLLREVEFSADDIIHAMIRPIYTFNNAPPRLQRFRYTLATFPYYDNWVTGTAGELMQIAAVHYIRNKLQSSHGGIEGDEKRRDRDYLQLAQMYREEYLQWVKIEKHRLNYSGGQGWGTIHSNYIRLG
jgi:hypothetical protein